MAVLDFELPQEVTTLLESRGINAEGFVETVVNSLADNVRPLPEPGDLFYLQVGLLTTASDGTIQELDGRGYERCEVQFLADTEGHAFNVEDVEFGPATDLWPEVTHLAIFDDSPDPKFKTPVIFDRQMDDGDLLTSPAQTFVVGLPDIRFMNWRWA